MLPTPRRKAVPTHWGTFSASFPDGKQLVLERAPGTTSEFWTRIESSFQGPERIKAPMVRKSFLERGIEAEYGGRGREPFVQVDWETALDLAASHLARVKRQYGNSAIFGGSYGWSSAGRFHHAQSQVHRFLNSFGGYTRSVNSYSYGAAEVILPWPAPIGWSDFSLSA